MSSNQKEREIWLKWFKKLFEIGSKLGAKTAGSHFGILTFSSYNNEAKRKEIYIEIQKKIQTNAYFYPILENKRIVVMSSTLAGVKDAALVPVYTFEDMSKLYFK